MLNIAQAESVTSLLHYELTLYAVLFVCYGVFMSLGALTYIAIFGVKYGKR